MRVLITSLLLSCIVLAQTSLPEYGDISDLKGMTKLYLSTEDAQARKYILDKLKGQKSLTVVSSPDDADFILECIQTGRLGQQTIGSVSVDMKTFQMTAYFTKKGKKHIAWQKSKNSVRYPPTLLTGDFLEALKNDRKQ